LPETENEMTTFEPDALLEVLDDIRRTLFAIAFILFVSLFLSGCSNPETLVGPTGYRACPVNQRCTFGADVYCYDGIGYRLCFAG